MTRVTEYPGRRTRRTGLRAAALAGVAAAAAVALGACSAGQISQTAYMQSAVPGVNQTFAVTRPDNQSAGSISLRDMQVTYNGANGYKAGGTAPLQLGIFNDTQAQLKVTVTAPGAAQAVVFRTGAPIPDSSPSAAASASPSAEASASASAAATASVKAGASASVKAGASASAKTSASAAASASAVPSEAPRPASGPATLTIPAGGFVVLSPQVGKYFVLQGLAKDLKPGGLVEGLSFQFQLDGDLQVQQTPAAPASGASPVSASCVFEGGLAVCRAPLGTPLEAGPRSVPTQAAE